MASDIKFKCIECSSDEAITVKTSEVAIFKACNNRYPIVEGVVLAIREKDDFYNYKNKLNRFFNW